jgi:release factor glutamine methyltransferase
LKTVQDYLENGAIDIAPFLSLVLDKSSAELILSNNYQLTSDEKSCIDSLILQREKGVPFAYLSGSRGFYHLDFKVTPDTLIPRPETELLIDIALELPNANKVLKVLDLGTGSGIIAVTLKDKNPHWQVSATDFCKKALEVARSNATAQIEFLQGSWLEPVINQSFDLIISNPPYIEENDVYLDDLSFEPITALTAGKDGLDDIRIIIDQAPNHLGKNGFLLLEHGHDQQARIVELLKQKFNNIQTFKDYNLKDRAILAKVK